MKLESVIRDFIDENILMSKVEYSDTDSLYDLNILESIGVLQLLTFLQNKLGIKTELANVEMESFETINSIVAFIEEQN